MSAQPELPLRPMTLGELLDAATVLLRRRAPVLFGSAALLAAGEQVLLAPLRAGAYLSPPWYGPAEDHVGAWWTVLAIGFGTETAVLTLLAGLAAAAAGPALLGRAVRHRQLFRRARPLATAVAAVLLGAAAAVCAFLGVVPWFVLFGLTAMTAPALVIDRARNAVGRSVVLAGRSGLRGFWVLVTAYLTWYAVRFALGAGWTALAETVTGGRAGWQAWLYPVSWGLANTVAYAALACVAAVLLLDVRVRTEGLDIAVGRARSRGDDAEATLVHAP
jgi:hypothetical protein